MHYVTIVIQLDVNPASVSVFKQDYYGKILKTSSDLKTDVCVTPSKPIPAFIRQALKRVHPEVNAR